MSSPELNSVMADPNGAVDRIEALEEALHEARMALFKIRACSVAGCEEGYGKPEKWADALFASHGDVAASLKTIDRVLSAGSTLPERNRA